MLTDLKQVELDKAEEIILTNIFGSVELDSKTQWLLKFLDIDVNDFIQNFENIIRPLMKTNGLMDAEMTRSFVNNKFPVIAQMIPTQDFRLSETVEGLLVIIKPFLNGIKQ